MMNFNTTPIFRLIIEKLDEALREKDWAKVESIRDELRNLIE